MNYQALVKQTRNIPRAEGLRKLFAVLSLSLCAIFALPHQQTLAQEIAKVSSVRLKPASEQYLIGPGDVLDIRVFNRPQLSRDAVRVDGRQMISMPLIGEIRAGCRTESELSREIAGKYLEYLRNPNVEVFIKDYQSRPVMVIGAVREPGRFQMQRRVRLLELLSLAGGPTEKAGGRIQVKHAPDAPACEEPNNDQTIAGKAAEADSVQWYDVSELLRDGENTPYVLPGDTVNLLEANKAFVVGNVVKPVEISLKEKVTVSKAVAMAGGTLPDSKLDKVRILRQTGPDAATKTEIIIDLRAINRQQAEDIALHPNDIIDVPISNGKKFIRGLMNSVAPTLTRLPVRVIN